ncbi:MAG: class I SAM-dependent methyltransferase [Rhodobacteraceae bacterium]|nr:MAG: class I SAM-dependent methyltransferase [Paracoccaceae bacterium]
MSAVEALIRLHLDTPRQGPGDPALLDRMVAAVKPPFAPQVADLGCGTGATAIRLAERLGASVLAVDAAAPFIAALADRLEAQRPVAGRVTPVLGDMLAPPVAPGSLDLIVSEGAAYAVGFETALAAWRPLVRPGGGCVVSECVWWGADRPAEAAGFWAEGYPGMGSVADALAAAEQAGWRFAAAERLPAAAWWTSYYDPLRARIAALKPGADKALAEAIAESEREMAVFERFSDAYGYVLLALVAP